MKLTVDRDRLADAVVVVGPAVSRRPAVPVLAGIRLRAQPESAAVAGFDYEVSAHARIAGAEVSEPGEVLVSGRLLAEIVKALPARPVEFCTVGDGLDIVCGRTRFALPLLAVEDYPQLPALSPTAGAVDRAALSAAVTQVAVAAGRDDTLPMLTGINLEFHRTFVRLVSTDRFRIAIRELDWRPAGVAGEISSVLIPARALLRAGTVSSDPEVEIGCSPGETIVSLATASAQHTMRVLDMPYAPYRSYLDDNRTAIARLGTAAMVEAIRRVSLLSPRGAQVRLAFTATAARLSAGGDGEGTAEETIPCEFDGEPLTIAFNPRYLLDGLTAIRAESVEIALNGPTRAATLRPAHRGPDEPCRDGLTYVLMPVRLPG